MGHDRTELFDLRMDVPSVIDGTALHVYTALLPGLAFVPALNDPEKHSDHIRDESLVVRHPIPDFDRQAENQLPYRHLWEHIVHQASGGVGCHRRRTHTPS
ncbi:MAG: hypothetical protein GY847_36665 [Proteobacteria bacterium]|nr:hypothetical protein [Pseudomonadota bacterium]